MQHREEWGCGHTYYWDFGNRHFGHPGEKELEKFASKVSKSQNVTHPLEEKAAKDFRILVINISSILKIESGRLALEIPKSRSDTPLEVGCGHEEGGHMEQGLARG